jgi:hypothetical protein
MASSPQTLPKSDILRQLEEFDTLSKLREGYKVTDVEKETLLTLASGAEAEARVADRKIARFHAVSLLEHSRDSLLKAASQARSLVAPIRKLPLEILGEIFFLTYSSIDLSDTAGLSTLPTVLAGNVCSSWRGVAISTRKLWSCITITMEHGLPPRAIQYLKEVLKLSGNLLLDLTVTVPCLGWFTWSEQMTSTAVFPVICKHSQRCKHLTLNGPIYLVVHFFKINLTSRSPNSESFSPQLPSLCSLEITMSEVEHVAPTVFHISSASAPNLRKVSITRPTYDHQEGLSFDFPWSQLDTLVLGVRYLSEFFDALSKSTSLTQAGLHYCFVHPEHSRTRFLPISSDTLTSLLFRLTDDTTYDTMSICFDKFTLPHLRELHVYSPWYCYYHLEWPMEPFKAFVNRSGFPITVLRIHGVSMRDSTLIAILECLPRLEALVAEEPEWGYDTEREREAEVYKASWLTNHLMERLQVCVRESAGRTNNAATSADTHTSLSNSNHEAGDSDTAQKADPFLPCLREINLKGKGLPDTFSFDTFLEMIRTRRAAVTAHPEGSVSNLKTVELRVWEQPVSEAVRKEIDTLRLCHEDLVLNVVELRVQWSRYGQSLQASS